MRIVILSLIIGIVLSVGGQTLTGKVVAVSDGDTIKVLTADNVQVKIRLAKIDAPEKNQAFGQRSKQRMSELVFGKEVRVEWEKKEKWGRILGEVYVGSTNVNLQMVKEGLAWHYKHFDKTAEYAQAESEARSKKLELWSDPNPIEPHQFRKRKKRK